MFKTIKDLSSVTGGVSFSNVVRPDSGKAVGGPTVFNPTIRDATVLDENWRPLQSAIGGTAPRAR